jgi:PPK2 family polyphosphate:nucleotide phosphotransferase
MSGVNPQACDVFAFKVPTPEEERHDFLWRYAKVLPERGKIGIFNRSYYEDVLVTRVHPDLLVQQHLPSGTEFGKKFWKQRFEDINAFERHLQRNGTKIVKVFLHLSRDEQKRRFLDRLDEPDKAWKFSSADLAERAHFDEYQQAYEAMLTATSTKWAPWFVVPADHKYLARMLVAGILARAIQDLHLQLPRVNDGERGALDLAKVSLLNE